MITKIKNLFKKLSTVEWVIIAIALLALVVALAPKGAPAHKGPHGGNKGQEKNLVKVAPAAK